jgi:hypothetical protein
MKTNFCLLVVSLFGSLLEAAPMNEGPSSIPIRYTSLVSDKDQFWIPMHWTYVPPHKIWDILEKKYGTRCAEDVNIGTLKCSPAIPFKSIEGTCQIDDNEYGYYNPSSIGKCTIDSIE